MFTILILLSVLSLVTVLVYRQWLQHELQRDMSIQVKSAVSRYIALSQVPELNSINQTDLTEESKEEEVQSEGMEIRKQGDIELEEVAETTLDD